ncbi:MAG: signal recognition particle-docking protein FtsY [Acholeplasmatales bacterium]|jgi:fused signal recognition particle receptor|nr:signal recognition particle-docking protein FtsY [Acholeplasmatales bacterium]
MGLFSKLFKKKPKNEKYDLGLHKSRETLKTLKDVLDKTSVIDDNLFDSLEDIFISADIGLETVIYFINELKKEVLNKNITSPHLLSEIIVDKMFDIYLKNEVVSVDLKVSAKKPTVYLFIGVNGTGKTTSIAKIGYKLKEEGNKVLLVAADTFRAGAIEQLSVWASKAKIDIYTKPQQTDPSSVIYDSLLHAIKEKYDYVLIDTAGRLQTKVNLMAELNKMYRSIKKVLPDEPSETLLVIDATTGQNGINQASSFNEAASVTGIILTKLDGTAKGGIVLAIRHLYNIPIKMVGLGEKIDDLVYFDIEDYIYGLFKEFF